MQVKQINVLRPQESATKKKKEYFYMKFRVYQPNGKATSISLDPYLATHAIRVLGGAQAVGRFARQVVAELPADASCSRSGYVAQRLEELIAQQHQKRQIAKPGLAVSV